MTRTEFRDALAAARATFPDWRYGQAAFNVAWVNGLPVQDLRGSYLDPFYDDSRVEAFIDAVFS